MAKPGSTSPHNQSTPSLDERFRAFVDATADVVYQMSADWRVMHQLLGKSFLSDTATANSTWLQEYIPHSDQDQVQAAIDEVIREKKPFELEHRVNRADGTIGWTLSRAVPLLDNQGAITEWFGTARDVTQQKLAQQAAHQREQQNAFLLRLTDTLRPLADPQAIQYQAARLLGEFLAASRVGYAAAQDDEQLVAVTLHYTQGVASIEGTYRYGDYGALLLRELQAGKTVVRPDITQDPTLSEAEKEAHAHLQLGATVNVPLRKQDRLVAIFFVHHQQARLWLAHELALIEETAERIWAAVERAKAEAAQRQSEQALAELRHLTLLSQTEALARMGSWEYHRTSGVFTWSAGMYLLTEVDLQRLLVPEIYLELVTKADQAQARSLIHYLRTGLGHFEGQLQIQVRDKVKTLRIKADVIGVGEATRVVGVDMDVTEQLLAQQQIRETADSLQAVLDSSPASIGLLKAQRDGTGLIIDFRLAVGNDKLASFFDEPLATLLGQPAQRFSALLWDGQTLARLQHIFTTQESFYEEKQLAPPEQDTWVALSVSQQDDGVVLTLLDITALKQAQAQQQHWLSELEGSRHSVDALAQLKIALQHRSESLRAVSHDLKSNFGIINSSISLLELADSEAEREQFVGMALRNVQQATGLLGELLDLTRLESSEQPRRLSSQNVSTLFEELAQNLTPLAEQQGLVLRVTGPAVLAVETDALLLYRLLQNLTMNALKYTHRGQVSLRWEPDDGQWWFTVEDTGSGLARHLVERLNAPDPLQAGAVDPTRTIGRGERTPRESWASLRGEGIGLRIVREIIYLLGARLAVSSVAGQGTRFTVWLPLRYSASPETN